MKSYKVTVAGQTFQIRSDAEEQYLKNIANEVTERFDSVDQKGPRAPQEFRGMVMVAMSILDELHETRKQRDTIKEKAKNFATKMIQHIDRILTHQK